MLFNILNFFSESIFFFLNGFYSAVVFFSYNISLVFNTISINETLINVSFILLSLIFVFFSGRGIAKIVKEASLIVGGLGTGYLAYASGSGSGSGDDDRKKAEAEARKAEAAARKAEAEARKIAALKK